MNPFTHPRWLLQGEGGILLAVSVYGFYYLSGNWWLFALLFFTPDIFALGYLLNVRIGATCYNLVHNEILPAILAAGAVFTVNPMLGLLAMIWLAHIGFDRILGFGLKYPTRFQDTHLQHV